MTPLGMTVQRSGNGNGNGNGRDLTPMLDERAALQKLVEMRLTAGVTARQILTTLAAKPYQLTSSDPKTPGRAVDELESAAIKRLSSGADSRHTATVLAGRSSIATSVRPRRTRAVVARHAPAPARGIRGNPGGG